ncbi:F-box/FBD/LRR-repeat protein At5g53840-like [Silene latifolia]|uniref:F-box/FBD/LRR-repeat protein At5g53840-like n=1 Tax=Silene latifolia TaxID=37657 RepID=UPI003D7896A7
MHSLVSLDLNTCHRIAASTTRSINLPNLKKLQLSWINYECLRRLLSCCPSLEELSLSVNEFEKHSVSLTSKKLKRLCMRLAGVSMVDVIIDAPILDELNYSSSSILSMQMLDSVSNVKSLELEAYTTRVSRGRPMKTIIFLNLTHLQLVGCLPLVIEAIGLMVHCPKLEVFVLRLIIFDKMVWNKEVVFVPVEHVKRIELHTSTIVDQFGEEMLNLVTLLLRSAKVLEKLTLYGRRTYFNYLNKPRFYQTLFECVEATSQYQVELLGVYELTS